MFDLHEKLLEMIKTELHYDIVLDEDMGHSDEQVTKECCDLTMGHLVYSELSQDRTGLIGRGSYIIHLSLKHGDEMIHRSFENHGRDLNPTELCNALNEILEATNYTGEKYFCDLSDGSGLSIIGFITFPKEKEIVETCQLYRGFGEADPRAYSYYYKKMKSYNQ